MRVEGNRVPDFLDRHGVIHTVHVKPHRMSPEEYASKVFPYNPNKGSDVVSNAHIDVIEPTPDLSNVSVEAIKSGDYDKPILVGTLDSELQVF